MEVNPYLSMFIDESKEHLQEMNTQLLKLETHPEELEIVQHIFRSAHTLKGMSATMGYEDLASLTHEMENILDLIRNGDLTVNTQISDVLFQSLDLLELMVEDIVAGGSGEAQIDHVVKSLQKLAKGETTYASTDKDQTSPTALHVDEFQRAVIEQSLESGYEALNIYVELEETCVLKAARAYMAFDQLGQHGEVIQSTPSVEDIEQNKFDGSFTVYYVTQADKDFLVKTIGSISEIAKVEVKEIDLSDSTEKTTTQVTDSSGIKEESNKAKNRSIRVDIDRLDSLMNLFSELLIDRVRLEVLAHEINRPELSDTVEHLSRVSGDLQDIVLKLRMVPVESVFNRFPRMVRDIAKSLDKKVELNILGADTELDRTVIDEIGDPLVHLIRNALDHGLESSSERRSAGKPETGTIILRAFHSGNHVFIEIEEDGRGIQREAIVKKALESGIITREQATEYSDHEIYQLLFSSGFSTADQISDLSGRGVGLDVVRSKITSLGGEVSVDSKPGEGSRFSVKLPLTLSIISAMLIRIGEEKYALPISSVAETSIIQASEIRYVHGMRMIHYREQVIPIVSLREIVDYPKQASPHRDLSTQTEELYILMISNGDKMVAVIVDEILGQQEIVLKSLGNYLTRIFAISGATILGDGQVALIIDPLSIIVS